MGANRYVKVAHTIYVNRAAKKTSSVPRHNEINNDLAKKICKDLQMPHPVFYRPRLSRGDHAAG